MFHKSPEIYYGTITLNGYIFDSFHMLSGCSVILSYCLGFKTDISFFLKNKCHFQKIYGYKQYSCFPWIFLGGQTGYKFSTLIHSKEYFCQICIHKLRQAKAKNYLDLVTNFILWLQIFQKTIYAPIFDFLDKIWRNEKK